MKKYFFYLLLAGILLQSCSKDLGTMEVTYTKATAIYGDLESVRNTPLIGETMEIENPGKIFVAEDFLLIGEEGRGIHVMDNSDPENPISSSFLNIPGNREFYVQGSILYAESYYDMLKIDLSNINQPQLDTRIEAALGEVLKNDRDETLIGFDFEIVTEKVSVDHPIAQKIWGDQNYYFYDYTQRIIPPSAVPASFAGSSSNAIGTVNRIAFAEDHVYLISRSKLTTFSDQGSFELLSSEQVGRDMETIYPDGSHLFVGTRNSMLVFDIASPANPNLVSSFFHATSCDPVYPVGDIAYLTLRTGDFGNCPGDINALVVLDVSNISTPVEIREIEMASPFGMTLIEDYLYVGEGENGLKIFDASEREHPKLEKADGEVEAYDIIRHPNRNDLILIAGTNGLQQYKIDGSDLNLLSEVSY
ncbi:MAG: hypothetical protein AAF849_14735 [Bacteroidota bacterium]